MTTVNTIMDRARRRLNEQDSKTFHSDSDFIAYIDEGQKYVARVSECLEGKYSMLTVAGQADYDLPSNFLVMKRVLYDGKRARPISFEHIDDEELKEVDINLSNEAYYYMFANQITIIPTPSTSGIEIKLFYIKIPNTVTSLDDVLEIPEYLEDSVATYVTYCAWLKDIEYELADYNLAECNAKIALLGRQLNEKDMDSQFTMKMAQSTKRRRPLQGL